MLTGEATNTNFIFMKGKFALIEARTHDISHLLQANDYTTNVIKLV
jgi:hypothetical protein